MKAWKIGRKRITLSKENTVLTIYYGKGSEDYKAVYHYDFWDDRIHIGHLVYDHDGKSYGSMKIGYIHRVFTYLRETAIKLEHKRYPTYAFNPNIPKEILEIL